MKIAVYTNDTTIPAWIFSHNPDKDDLIEFTTFEATPPPPSVFTIPSVCQKKPTVKDSNANCVNSSTALARADIWVNYKIPRINQPTYDGYPTTQVGFVNFVWETPKPGYSFTAITNYIKPVAKEELLPGDILLNPKQDLVLFGGWSNQTETSYWAYFIINSCSDNPDWCSVERENITYPFYYDPSVWLPYRYINSCGY
eukprot:Phypoly_transcript_20062.p1 GENE.Phypoly_transcript_20062~~Phypoly_transcript_20062.p1  ORF type:complete len:199 (+),score=26.38 Phypoly_transcript_20062:2-598(+)